MASPHRPRVGVLALQGDFEAHGQALAQCGAHPIFVRFAGQLADLDGLVLPGGESTTMLRLLDVEKLKQPLARFAREKPVLATCAGVILLAREVTHPRQESLDILDLSVERNGYGRQIDSRIVPLEIPPDSELNGAPLEAVFIRAPVIQNVGPRARVLATYLHHPVLVRQDRHLAATFHPELTGDTRIHRMFLGTLK